MQELKHRCFIGLVMAFNTQSEIIGTSTSTSIKKTIKYENLHPFSLYKHRTVIRADNDNVFMIIYLFFSKQSLLMSMKCLFVCVV